MTPEFVGAAAQLACWIAANAHKPGHLLLGHDFRDQRYEDFLASGASIGYTMARAGERPIDETVQASLESTRQWVTTDTNLGLMLLFAPIARAALMPGPPETVKAVCGNPDDGKAPGQDLRNAIACVLESAPAAMKLLEEHEAIAREYTTRYSTTFNIGLPTLLRARHDGLHWDSAVTETYLTLLGAAPDSTIVRRTGMAAAAMISRAAQTVVTAGGIRSENGRTEMAALDQRLREAKNIGSPQATADLTTATVFVALLGGAWRKR